MPFLRRAFRIDAQPDRYAGLPAERRIAAHLRGRVQDDVVAQREKFLHIRFAESGGKRVYFPGEMLPPEARFIDAARRRSREVAGDERIGLVDGIGLLREEDLAAGRIGDAAQDL